MRRRQALQRRRDLYCRRRLCARNSSDVRRRRSVHGGWLRNAAGLPRNLRARAAGPRRRWIRPDRLRRRLRRRKPGPLPRGARDVQCRRRQLRRSDRRGILLHTRRFPRLHDAGLRYARTRDLRGDVHVGRLHRVRRDLQRAGRRLRRGHGRGIRLRLRRHPPVRDRNLSGGGDGEVRSDLHVERRMHAQGRLRRGLRRVRQRLRRPDRRGFRMRAVLVGHLHDELRQHGRPHVHGELHLGRVRPAPRGVQRARRRLHQRLRRRLRLLRREPRRLPHDLRLDGDSCLRRRLHVERLRASRRDVQRL